MFSNIVWATDGSEPADRAFELACRLAREGGGRIHAVHVIEKMVVQWAAGENVYLNEADLKTKVKGQVRAARERGLDVALRMPGAPSAEIAQRLAEVADEVQADVIVIGTRGRSTLAATVVGSVTHRLLHLAHCPVLAVPPRQRPNQAATPSGLTASERRR
ncbi:MAG TPA: universal stress protein [Solirubrobacteraceae bacterium]